MSEELDRAEADAVKALDQLARIARKSAVSVAQNRLIDLDVQMVLHCIDLQKGSNLYWRKKADERLRRLDRCQSSLMAANESRKR